MAVALLSCCPRLVPSANLHLAMQPSDYVQPGTVAEAHNLLFLLAKTVEIRDFEAIYRFQESLGWIM